MKNHALSVACGAVLMAAAWSAFGQTPSGALAPSVEEVIVTGVRASVIGALDQKQNSIEISDSIVAEDIGKLPDNSVSEAVQRVTGVQIARARGDANLVLIRGLPDIVTTINDRHVFTAANRNVTLADIPADLVKKVQVFKTQAADQFSGGLVGAINVDLRRPFDFNGAEMAVNVRGIYSDETEDTNPIVSVLASNRWEVGDGEFGALLSLSYQDKNYLEANTFNGTYDRIDPPGSVPTPNDPGDDIFRPFVIGSIYTVGETTRESGNLSLQWAPSDKATFYFDGFYTKYDEDYALNFFIPLPGISVDSFTLRPGTNVAQTYSSSNIFSLTSNQAFARKSRTWQGALGGDIRFTDTLSLRTDLSYTRGTAGNRDAILDTGFIAPRLEVDFSQRGASNARVLNADGTPFDVTDSSNFFLNQLFDQRDDQASDDTNFTAKLRWELDGGFFDYLSTGIQVGRRTATNNAANGAGIPFPVGQQQVFVDDVEGLTGLSGIQDVTPSSILKGDRNISTRQWFIANREFLLENTAALRTVFGVDSSSPPNDPTRFFDDTEETKAGYLQSGFAVDIGSLPLDGLLGLRVVNVDAELRGTARNTDTATGISSDSPVSISKSKTRVLPSLNMRLKLREDLFLRLSGSQTVNRPRFLDLNPQVNLRRSSGNTLPGQGDGGNPNLDDPEALNADISLEWYFAPGSALALAGFYRDIDGYIQTFNSPEVFGGVTFQVTRPRNTDARLEGVEFAYTQFYDMLPGWLSGFGTQLNFTYVDATADIPDLSTNPVTFRTGEVSNVSKQAYNVILIYEKFGLSSRLAYNWRDDYIESYNQSGAQPPAVVVKDAAQLDYSLGYDLSDKITLSFDATNLLDRPVLNYFGTRSAQDSALFPRDVRSNDRTFALGVRVRL